MAATSDFILFALLVPSLVIYFLFMYTLFKFRKHEKEFKSVFFKIIFHLGVIDIIRLIEDWCMFKFPMFAWFYMEKVVMTFPHVFAKLHSIFFWYFAHAQVFGVLCLAINRVCTCVLLKKWHKTQLQLGLLVIWGLPLATNVPLWFLDFYFASNITDGAALLYWTNKNWQHHYLMSCGALCSATGILCSISYIIIFIKVRKGRKGTNVRNRKRDRAKLNLVIVGAALSLLGACCGGACFMMASGVDPDTLAHALPYFNLVNDMWCWINPYLLIICSRPVKQRMKMMIPCRSNNKVIPATTKKEQQID